MRTARAAIATCFLGVACVSSAFPGYWKVFEETYHPKAGTAIADGKCLTCHLSIQGGARNPFGRDVQMGLKDGQVTQSLLKSLESKDSDGDGVSNGDEIAAGTLPGNASSKPAGSAGRSAPPAEGDDIPKHTFHPSLVHFPIALFLFGALLEAVGAVRKEAGFRDAAKWNLIAAAFAAWTAVPTGLIAASRLGFALTPGSVVFTHLLLGSLSALLFTGIAVMRRTRTPSGVGYWLLLAVAAAAVAGAGHLGGTLVFG